MNREEYGKRLTAEIREARKMKSLHEYLRQEYLDEGGNAVIDVQLDEELTLFDPLSMGKQTSLNPEIIDYIDRKSNLIPTTMPIVICFHGRSLSEAEQAQVKACLAEHYTVALHDKAWDLRTNNFQLAVLTVLGVVLLSIYLFFALREENALFIEILSIFGSFALWEAADRFLIERSAIRCEMLCIAQNKIQTVKFADGEEP